MKDKKFDCTLLWLLPMFMLMVLGMTLGSCVHYKYVPVENTKYEYITKDSIRIDSTYVHDSIFIREKQDTVFKDVYKYIYRYQYLTTTDTIIRIDSIQVPYPVEKQLTKWQQMKVDFGETVFGAFIGLLLLLVGYIVYIKKFKRM